MTISPNLNYFTAPNDTDLFLLTVSDSLLLDSQYVKVIILPVNDAPIIEAIESDAFQDIYIDEGDTLALDFIVYDVDNLYEELSLERSIDYQLMHISDTSFFEFEFEQPDRVTMTMHPDYNGSIFIDYILSDNSNIEPQNLKDTSRYHIHVAQINDPIDTFSIEEQINQYHLSHPDLLDNIDFLDLYDTTTFMTKDEAFYLKYPQLYTYDDFDKNNIYNYYQSQVEIPTYIFIWNRTDTLDVDTNPYLNAEPYDLYFRLELFDENKNYIIKDSILDSEFSGRDNGYIITRLVDEYKYYNIDEFINEIDIDSMQKEKLDLNGNVSYKWRVVAQNYSTDETVTAISPDNSSVDNIYIDLTYPDGNYYFLLNQIYIDYYDMYFKSNETVSFFDSTYFNYYNAPLTIDEMEFIEDYDNGIYYTSGRFSEFGVIDCFVITADDVDNYKIHRKYINFENN